MTKDNKMVLLSLELAQSDKYIKSVITYFSYFASKYISADLSTACGSLFDHPYVKTFTLWCIMYQASEDHFVATVMTIGFLCLQYIMSRTDSCEIYKDRSTPIAMATNLEFKNEFWPKSAPLYVDDSNPAASIPSHH